jgi:hypothetical protein
MDRQTDRQNRGKTDREDRQSKGKTERIDYKAYRNKWKTDSHCRKIYRIKERQMDRQTGDRIVER